MKKEYKIDNVVLTLYPLTIGQVKELVKLFENFEINAETKFYEFFNQIIDDKLIQFMEIIFSGQPTSTINWMQIPYDQIDEIIEDFLSLNPRLTNRLRSLLGNLALLAAQQNQPS